MTRIGCLLVATLTACTVGEGGKQMHNPPADHHAMGAIAPTDGNTVTGTVNFTYSGAEDRVSMLVMVSNAPPGMHGFHIHNVGACGNNGMDAGAHWDGAAAGDPLAHGLPNAALHHVGDTGNIGIGADGTGTMMMESPAWTLGDGAPTDVVGRAVIFHVNPDDGTMASAGARAGCGVITAVD
jgi:Cu-Zn family superoxide dismutase